MVQGVSRNTSVVAASGSGVWLTDVGASRYLDLTSGIGALSTGHCHPAVVRRTQQQVATLVHAQQNCIASHTQLRQLSNDFGRVTELPASMDRVFFTNSGTDAVENAVKLARRATNRPNIVACIGGFHGRSFGGMSLSTSKVNCRTGFAPLLAGVHHLPFPAEDMADGSWHDALATLLLRVSAPEDTAAFIVEPVLGEGGIVRADPACMRHLRRVCDDHGILLIADEVQTGCGRTGQWWGYMDWERGKKEADDAAHPDIVVFGKGIASGYPIAGIAASEALFSSMGPNSLGGTYNGNAVACAAANATLDVLHDVVPTVEAKGSVWARQLRDRLSEFAHVGEVRQYGLMVAIDMHLSEAEFAALIRAAPTCGLLVLTTGVHTTVRLLPPLTITPAELDLASERLCAWIGAVRV